MSYAVWDIETTTDTSFKRKANPYDPRNWTVTHGVKHKGSPNVLEVRFGRNRPPSGWLKPILCQANGTLIRLLIGMNIKFDLSHAIQDAENLELWMDYVAEGGMVWDIQLAEYLLNGQEQKSQMLSLDEIAPRYGGNIKVDEVKALWNAGVRTEDIEPALLTRYLCGGPDEDGVYQLGDVENTEVVALAQIKRAREAGQLNSILLNMGALLFTIEAERNGMFVDKPLGLVLAEELKKELEELKLTVERYIPDHPYKGQFNWNSRFDKSALIFGGTVEKEDYEYDLADGGTILKTKYDALEYKPALAYFNKEELHYVLENGGTYSVDYYDAENFAGTPDLPERATFKGGKNAGEYKTKKVKVPNLAKPKGRAVKAPWTMPGYTEPEPQWESTDKGFYSTAAEVIEELGDRDVPFLKAFASMMKMAKDLGTYFITTDEETGEQKGMLTMVDPMGIIHHMLNMVSTITARLSSSNPNLQNIPKGNKSKVKLLFKSRFGPDGKIIQSDFSSLEVYVQAILTGCKQLIADLKAGLDLHCVRLAAKEHMEYEEVLKLAKGYKLPDGTKVEAVKEWDYKRTGAKVYSFQRAFGAGIKKIAKSTGMTEDETQALADAEDERYPEIPAYYEDLTMSIQGTRVPTKTVPHPFVRGVMCNLGKGWTRTPDGKLYSYEEQPAPDYQVKRGKFASFSPTEIRNYVVQGTGGEWAKAGMYLSVRAFYKRRNFGGRALLVNQVHDAVYADAAKEVAFEAAALLHACMEAASDYMEWKFKWPIPVPVPSDTTWGASMMDEDSIDNLKERAAVLRNELRQEYMDGYVPSFV